MKRFFILTVLLPLLFVSCGKKTNSEEEISVELQGIGLNKRTAEMEIGQTLNLIVVYNPEAAEKYAPEVTWESSSPRVATVENGKVTGKQKGKATITAYCGKFYADCQVEVLTGGDNVIDWNAPYMYISPNVINDNSYGGEYEITVTSNQNWTASVSEPWLVVTPYSGENDGKVKITVAEKKTADADQGVVTFTAGEITKKVTVKRAERYIGAPLPDVSQVSVPMEGKTFTVGVYHSSSEWSASCSDPNVTFSDKTNNSITVTVAPNKSLQGNNPSDKTMEVTFKNKEGLSTTMTIVQPNPYASFQLITQDREKKDGTIVKGGEEVNEISSSTGDKYELHIHTNIPWALEFKYRLDDKWDSGNYMEADPSSGKGDRLVKLRMKNIHTGRFTNNKGALYFNGTGAWENHSQFLYYTFYYQGTVDNYKFDD